MFNSTKLVGFTKENGATTTATATVTKCLLVVTPSREIMFKAELRVKAFTLGRVERSMTESGKVVLKSDMESGKAFTVKVILGNGATARLTAMEYTCGVTVTNMKVSGSTA